MPPTRHVVKSGESLWRISEKTLGGGAQWPRLWRYNNRRDVVKVTRRGIPDPDLIYPGQVLLIPVLPHLPVRTTHPPPAPPASGGAPPVASGSSTPAASR